MCLVYRGRTWSRIFYVFWYLFLTLFCIGLATLGTDQPLEGAERVMPFAIPTFLVLLPIFMHVIGTRNSERELEELVDFLGRVAQAKPSRE